MDPGPYTLAELLVMVEARRRTEWEPLSLFMALFANVNRDKKRKAFTTEDFFPFDLDTKKKDHAALPKADITDLKFMFKEGVKDG